MSLPACLGILLLAALLVAQPTFAWIEGQHSVDLMNALDLGNSQTAERAASGVRETIEALTAEYVKQCKQNNMDGVKNLLDEQIIVMPQGYGVLEGKSNIDPYLKWIEDVKEITMNSIQVEPLDSSATYVFQRSESEVTDLSGTISFNGKSLRIWKKDGDGTYKIYIDMYNTGR
ncbi:uncharacterized protein LOC110978020 [Acanthaster planci]|uniref:Uncharacterized protein LOC110978020 n=1 Tax=Acanthaster planci TaxID=133434 RepID=A0A8B7Y9E5_ACAPL|nr:uncharacterized protein LOC110978020 [Acanthaster planci]